MSNVYPFFSEADEAFEADELFGEADEADESDEARRPQRRMRAPIRTPQRGGNLPLRPASGFATRTELAVAIKNVDTKIGTLSTGVKALDGRVRSVDNEQAKLRSSLAAEAKKREAIAGQVNSLQQMSMILPMLTSQKTVTLSASGVDNIPGGSKVVVDSGDVL